MIPRSFRQFDNITVPSYRRTKDVLKQLNDKYIGYRTEGIVPTRLYNGGESVIIYYSYVENFSLDDQDTEEPEEIEENLYGLYEVGVEPNHVE
jgi:hypothetical protein